MFDAVNAASEGGVKGGDVSILSLLAGQPHAPPRDDIADRDCERLRRGGTPAAAGVHERLPGKAVCVCRPSKIAFNRTPCWIQRNYATDSFCNSVGVGNKLAAGPEKCALICSVDCAFHWSALYFNCQAAQQVANTRRHRTRGGSGSSSAAHQAEGLSPSSFSRSATSSPRRAGAAESAAPPSLA